MSIASLEIHNYKSIRSTGVIPLRPINVLIGANGVGKSNFISFFSLVNSLYSKNLQLHIAKNARADNILHFGRKVSTWLGGKISFDNDWRNEYEFRLEPDAEGSMFISGEWSNYTHPGTNEYSRQSINTPGSKESGLPEDGSYRSKYLRENISSFRIFHFHDTGSTSKLRQPCTATDYSVLARDGGNLPAFLFRLKHSHETSFRLIEKVITSIAPFFDRFFLEPDEINPNQIMLRWLEKGSDQIFYAHNLSDGTLRMMCLTTLLLQPQKPATIIIDEPELGLHPFAITKLAALIKSAAEQTQLIISTQSVGLVNQFEADDIIVVEREAGQSVFRRQSQEGLSEWLDEYTIGLLSNFNVL